MAITVTRTQLTERLREILDPILNRHLSENLVRDASSDDSIFVECCRNISNDLCYMFGYTADGEIWSHIDNLATTNPFPNFFGLSINMLEFAEVSNFLYDKAEAYFSQDLVRLKELDWFYLDFVIAVSYRVLSKAYGDKDFAAAYPVLSKAINDFHGSNYWVLVKYILLKLVKNSLVVGLVIFLFFVAADGHTWAGLLGGSLFALKLYRWFSQIRMYGKLNLKSKERLEQIVNLYKLFSNGIVRWDLLEQDIKRFRVLGIEFPLAIDTAISSRKN